MKSSYGFTLGLLALLFVSVPKAYGANGYYPGDSNPESSVGYGDSEESHTVVRHIVSFKFKSTVTQEQIDNVVAQFLALKQEIPTVVSLEEGINNSKEQLNKGFTHTFIVTFNNTDDRDEYVDVAPPHQAFKKLVGPLLDDVFVFDFSTSL